MNVYLLNKCNLVDKIFPNWDCKGSRIMNEALPVGGVGVWFHSI